MNVRLKYGYVFLCATCLAVVFMTVSPAVATDGGKNDTLQLDRWANALWSLGLFLALVGILGRYCWKPVQRAILAREQALVDVVKETERRRSESEQMLVQYKDRLGAAEKDVERMLQQAQADAETTREEILAQARKQAAVAIAEAQRQILDAKSEALDDIYRNTAELATEIAAKIVRKEISIDDHHRLVDEGLKRLEDQA